VALQRSSNRQRLHFRDESAESWGMERPQKITFAEMRSSGVRGLLVYCSDYRCSHYIAISGDGQMMFG
jgi:hypothetical protein